MDSETEDLVYCDLCGHVPVHNLCQHFMVQESETEIDPEVEVQGETFEELLISLVESRPPLWNTHLPLMNRSKSIRDKFWMEIYEALQKQYTIEFLQKKWRNLRDTYIKKKSEIEYVPSGSESQPKKRKWKHFDLLKFLSDVTAPRNTSSNLQATPTTSKISTIKSKKSVESTAVEHALLEAINNVQPPQETRQEINPICIRISQILDKLDEESRARLELRLLTETYKVAYPNL